MIASLKESNMIRKYIKMYKKEFQTFLKNEFKDDYVKHYIDEYSGSLVVVYKEYEDDVTDWYWRKIDDPNNPDASLEDGEYITWGPSIDPEDGCYWAKVRKHYDREVEKEAYYNYTNLKRILRKYRGR
jgi:hypothetical protein